MHLKNVCACVRACMRVCVRACVCVCVCVYVCSYSYIAMLTACIHSTYRTSNAMGLACYTFYTGAEAIGYFVF